MIMWASVHDMLDEQFEDLKNNHFFNLERENIKMLKDINKDLFNQISNTPSKKADILLLVNKFVNFMVNNNFSVVIQPEGNIVFQIYLANACMKNNIAMYYAHSERVSEERKTEDGRIEKISYFKHKCFIKIDGLDFEILKKINK